MKIYTKTGDKGTTGLLGGSRVMKSDLRIETYGTVDELNAYIGLLRDQPENNHRSAFLIHIQEILFTIGSHLANESNENKFGIPAIMEQDIEALEQAMDEMDESLPPLKNFILPGGHVAVSQAHIARTVCRRAERWVIRLAEDSKVDDLIVKFLNRLSDYLFVLSRKLASETGAKESPWKPR